MGSKGSNTTTTNQTQTYAPAGAGYIQNALQQGQNVAGQGYTVPTAPVAGFSQDQLSAFQNVNNAQGMAQPYINQAQQYFSPQGTQSFLNPYASNVMAGLQNVFGQQDVQNTANLTQSAGGVGADRIAVGQANLANQQGLAAGQTLSGLYNNAVQQAQSAGYGTAALGSQAQNAALQGAQAQLGTGGLQQQLSQAQLNAPYQQQLAQLAQPYQLAQFNAGITGALAPGLGGTTTGQGTTTAPAPSLLSQILGGGTAAVGLLGGTGAFGNSGYLTGSNGLFGGSGSGKGANPSAAGTVGSPYAGPVYSGYAEGGAPSDEPIDVAQQSMIPATSQIPHIQAQMPNLNLNPPAQQQQSGGGGLGSLISGAVKLGSLFAKDGGRINPYFSDGGSFHPYFADGGDSGVINPDEPFRMPDAEAVQNWRDDTDAAIARGQTANAPADGMQALSYAPTGGAPSASHIYGPNEPSPLDTAQWPQGPVGGPNDAVSAVNQFAPGAGAQTQAMALAPGSTPAAQDTGNSFSNFAKSPWMALTAAGLGIMGGTSPFAGVNIGQGAMAGLKTLETQRTEAQKDETIKQAADRLKQEAKFHEDQYTRSTPFQQFEMKKPFPMGQTVGPLGLPMTTYGVRDKDGNVVPVNAPTPEGGDQPNPVKDIVDGIKSGKLPPDTTGLSRLAPAVKAGLAKDGFDLTQAQLEMAAAKKQILSLNGPQMVRYVGLARTVDNTIDEVNLLAQKMKNGGIPLVNAVKLQAYIQGEGNSPNGKLAASYLTAVNTLKEEFANLANGGYAPTAPAWKLANEQINGNYGVDELGASLGEVQRLIRYRLHGIPNMDQLGPGAGNRYVPGGGGAPAAGGAGPGAPAAGAAQPPAAAIAHLKAHPELRGDFDTKFGQGAAAAILGQ